MHGDRDRNSYGSEYSCKIGTCMKKDPLNTARRQWWEVMVVSIMKIVID